MERRALLRWMVGGGAAALLPGGVWLDVANALASPAVPGAGPYGPLGAPDANGLRLPAGFSSRLLAVTGQTVAGTTHVWHAAPDGGGCVPTADGGWIYLSNAEVGNQGGGVSALRFGPDGSIVDAYSVLSGTSRNCAGGVTPWNTWLSCEEAGANGEVYECDPYAPGQGIVRPAMGHFNHEAAAVDPVTGDVYLTEDQPDGRLYRFVPDTPGDLSAGLLYAAAVGADDVISWIPSDAAVPDRNPATTPFDGGEGVYHGDGVLWFATKGDNRVWELDLATRTLSIAYDCDAHPDGELTDVDNVVVHAPTGRVFVAEDAGNMELGVLAGPPGARTMSIALRFEGHGGSEVTGIAFSPDGTRLYLSSQRGTDGSTGATYEIVGPWDAADPTPPPPPTEEIVGVSQMGWVRGGSYAGMVMGGGTDQQICFNGTATYSRRTFFSVPLGLAPGASFERATLRVSARVWTGDGAFVVEPTAADWDAASLTWDSQPAVTGGVLGSGSLTADRTAFEFDVTDHVNGLAALGEPVASFAIRQTRRNGPLGYVDGPGRSDAPTLAVVRSAEPPPSGQTVTSSVPIARDSWVRGGSFADMANASSRLLQVCNNGNPQYTRWAYLGIDLPPLDGTITRATLRINARLSAGSDIAHELSVVGDDWSDTTLVWNGRPEPIGGPVATFSIAGTASGWYELDVTAVVAAAASADATSAVSFVIRQARRNGPLAYVNPTNHWTSDVPELVVERVVGA